MTDADQIRDLAERWRERKVWAEQLLIERLGLDAIVGIFQFERAVEHEVPGTDWRFQTHGIGVSVHRPPGQTGGIDFDLDKSEPDGWRLHEFARRQVDEGTLSPEVYERLFSDPYGLEEQLLNVLD